jgi:hypothetical protein
MTREFQVLYRATESTGTVAQRPSGPVMTAQVTCESQKLAREQFESAGLHVIAVNFVRFVADGLPLDAISVADLAAHWACDRGTVKKRAEELRLGFLQFAKERRYPVVEVNRVEQTLLNQTKLAA